MTTAHRPTFDPARGKAAQAPTRIYHSRMLPAHTQLKYRKRGQGGAADREDLNTPLTSEERQWEREAMKRELLEKEARHESKIGKKSTAAPQLMIEAGAPSDEAAVEEDEEEKRAKRRRLIMEEAQKNEASDDEKQGSGSDNDSEDESSSSDDEEEDEDDNDDEEDETAELMRELERIKRERAAEKERQEREKQAALEAERAEEALAGNPLLNFEDTFVNGGAKQLKRWDEDVVFKNQAKGIDGKEKNRFINDMLRSDFHKKFMNKYVK
ncbi:Pre-mRNA-splicing factor Cwf15/Cwc15 [Kockiozyma suomiensis]|uniref:Pre-mRNA-splicing factor Cwf15/Cwc15 n=1 Tax=Kockiozyma suomiensis TaxID=1337062 RepID=UPI003343C810